MKNPIVVNLFGGPGVGKSSGAAYIFSQLKMANINCELITEAAKDYTWEGNQTALSCQEYVFGEQSYRMYRCRSKVDVIITDSPLLLSYFYNRNPVLDEHFETVVKNVFNSYTNLNYFIVRDKPYNPIGRNQTEEESKEIDKSIIKALNDSHIPFVKIQGNSKGYDQIVCDVKDILEDFSLKTI